MGANDAQTVRTFLEAEAYDGPSLIIAYSHCIAHGIDIANGLSQQKLAVDSGYWPLFRYNPALAAEGKNPMKLDSKAPKLPLHEFTRNETRFSILHKQPPQNAQHLLDLAQHDVAVRWNIYQHLALSMEPRRDNGAEENDQPVIATEETS
jgi:pyruvate-ferredoxin/flavodoxin oxidoreductase